MSLKQLSDGRVREVKVAVFVLALLPLARLVYGAVTGGLGANPVEFITRSTGTWTLVFLCLTLTVTPLRKIAGLPWLLKLRRMLGLFAFFYVLLHFTTYVWLDVNFEAAAVVKDIFKRPFITAGFTALVLMLPLALTSNNAVIKRLGGKRWQALHRLVYAIAVLGVVHYWWLVKRDITQPLIYAVIVALLLGWRLWHIWQRARSARAIPQAQPGLRSQAG